MKNKDKSPKVVQARQIASSCAPFGKNTRRNSTLWLALLMFFLAFSSSLGQLNAQTYTIGPVNPSIGTISSTTLTNHFQLFNVLDPSGVVIETIDLYPTATVGSAFTIVVQNSAQTVIATYSGTTTVTGGSTPMTVPVDFTIPVGTGYRLGWSTNPGMNRNTTGASYPYTVPNLMTITGNTFDPVYWYWFYNIQIKTTAPPAANDAGIASVVSPTSPVSLGAHMVTVQVKNFGTANLTNTLVQWKVDGVSKTPKPWVGSLAPGGTANFDLFNHTFTAGMHTIQAWTNNPNGQFDSNANNDTATVQLIACDPLSGSYTVGPTGFFPDLAAAIQAINLCGISSHVTLNVESGTYNGQVTLPQVAGLDATRTVTIQSATGNAADVVLNYAVTGSADNWTLKFDGADYFTVKNVTLKTDPSVATDYAKVVVFDNGANYNTLQNCVIIGKPTTNDSDADWYTVHCNGANDANFNTITGNTISGGVSGIYFAGGSGTGLTEGNVITNNTITGYTYHGIYFGYQKFGVVRGNTVTPNPIPYSTVYGYYVYYSDSANLVAGNKAFMSQTSTSGTVYGMNLYYCDGTVDNPLVVANNWVSLISGGATLYGIYSTTGTSQRYYHNSVQVLAGDGASEYAMYVSGGTDLMAANNLLANFSGGYAAYAVTSPVFTYLDHNNLYSTATPLAYYNGTNYATLAAWQAGTGADGNSTSFDPFYTSATDLTPSNTPMDNQGTPIAIVPLDIFGAARSLTTPDIGAVEYTGSSATMALTAGFACDGNQVSFPVTAQNFNNVAGISLALNHGAGFSFVGLQNVHASLAGILANGAGGQALISWLSSTGNGVNLPNGTLFDLVFNANVAGTYDLNFDMGPNGCEIVKGNGDFLMVSFVGDEAIITPCSDISGTLKYNNVPALPPVPNTPMGGVSISLLDGTKGVFASTVTNAAGNYSFTNVPNGTYDIAVSTTKPWGGVNSVDALLILKHFAAMPPPLTGIHLKGSDVDKSGTTNSADALLTARRSVGQITSFAAGNWYFDAQDMVLTQDTTYNFFGLCFGDVNGTYQPAKSEASVKLGTSGTLAFQPGQEVVLPLSVSQAMEIGAVALEVRIPAGLEVLDVEMPSGEFLWHLESGMLRISWFSLEPLNLGSGEPLLRIRALVESVQPGSLSLSVASELADAQAQVYPNALLTQPKLVLAGEGQSLTVNNYPNPFSGMTTVEFQLPSSGNVNLSLFDVTGAQVLQIADGMFDAGLHQVSLNGEGLADGIYFLRLSQHGMQVQSRIHLIK